MEGTRNQGNPNELGIPEITPDQLKQVSENLARNYHDLSPQGQSVIEDFSAEVLGSIGTHQTSSSEPIYAVPQKGNNVSRNDTPPPLPSPLRSESGYVDMIGSINESEIPTAVDQAVEIVSSSEAQERLKDKIKSDPSFSKKMQEKWNSLNDKDKSLFGLSTFGIAIGAPLAIVALPILATVAAVAGLAIAIIGGLKLATPSKAEFKKTGQEIMHSAKNAANIFPGKTNLERLWKSINKPGVTAKNPNLEMFLTKYCFPDQKSGEEVKVKFDPDKIEALKHAVEKVGLNLNQDIGRMVNKGNSVFSSDYAKDTQFIATASEIATAVMEKHNSPDPNNSLAGIQDIFKDKLNEIKQAKSAEEAAKKENSLSNKIKSKLPSFNRSSSHTESVEAGRRESSNGQSRGY